MKPLNPIQLRQAGPVFARAIANLKRLENRLMAEIYHAQQQPGMSYIVGQIETDLDQLRAENRALADIFDTHSTALIAIERAMREAKGALTVTIAGGGVGTLAVHYEREESQ